MRSMMPAVEDVWDGMVRTKGANADQRDERCKFGKQPQNEQCSTLGGGVKGGRGSLTVRSEFAISDQTGTAENGGGKRLVPQEVG